MQDKLVFTGLTFDDVLIEPRYSEVVPAEVSVATRLTKRIELRAPILSSPMDTVTEHRMAIGLAQEGGLGVIHKNMSIEAQSHEVDKVKRSANGIIFDPVTLPPDASVAEARQRMQGSNVSGVPIVGRDGKLAGIITRRDLRFLEDSAQPVSEVMTRREQLVTATGTVSLGEAEKILMAKKVEKLLLVDENYKLTGLITIKDIDMMRRFPQASKDAQGRLRVGAAIGVFDFERAESLIAKDVDVLIVDSAHGHSSNVIETVKQLKSRWDIDVVAGNVATADGSRDLIKAGADAVKVGIGPGSICTTRVISGIGVPQITAIYNAAKAAADSQTPIIADGGIRYSGDITKALVAGAHVVMLGGLLAGLDEAPGERVLYQGRTYKAYRGMGSLGAMVKGSSERYRQKGAEGEDGGNGKLVPEGVEGRVPYKGPLSPFLYQMLGGLRAGMGYCGAKTIDQLRTDARFVQVSPASVRESHPHDIAITQESPNYTAEFKTADGGYRWAALGAVALGCSIGALEARADGWRRAGSGARTPVSSPGTKSSATADLRQAGDQASPRVALKRVPEGWAPAAAPTANPQFDPFAGPLTDADAAMPQVDRPRTISGGATGAPDFDPFDAPVSHEPQAAPVREPAVEPEAAPAVEQPSQPEAAPVEEPASEPVVEAAVPEVAAPEVGAVETIEAPTPSSRPAQTFDVQEAFEAPRGAPSRGARSGGMRVGPSVGEDLDNAGRAVDQEIGRRGRGPGLPGVDSGRGRDPFSPNDAPGNVLRGTDSGNVEESFPTPGAGGAEGTGESELEPQYQMGPGGYQFRQMDQAPMTPEQQEAHRKQLEKEEAQSKQNCEDIVAAVKADDIKTVSLSIRTSGEPGEDFPFECGLGQERFQPRSWSQVTYLWKASGLAHKPLYFEQVQMERYGHSWGPVLDPIVSGAHFFGTLPILPYKMGLETPNECVYTLGYYRPGSCAPYMIPAFPFTWRAAAFEGGAWTAGVIIFP